MIRSLLLTSRPPWPSLGGDRLRTSQLARVLATVGPVHLVTGGPSEGPAPDWFASVREVPHSAAETAGAVARGLLRGASLQESVYATGQARAAVEAGLATGVDVVVAHLLRTVPWVPDQSPPLVVCLQDAIADQAHESRRAPGRSGGWRRTALAVDASRLADAERRALTRADAVTFITGRDRDLVLTDRRVLHAVVPAGVEHVAARPGQPLPDTVVFAGNLRTASNQDMVQHLARDLMPLVRSHRPQTTLDIVGIEAPPAVRALQTLPGVRVVGPVADMPATLSAAWVTACPLRFGSGIQNKVLESLAVGTPVVATARVAGSLVDATGSGVVFADGDAAFADALVSVLADRERRDALGARGITWIATQHRFPGALQPLVDLVREIALRAP